MKRPEFAEGIEIVEIAKRDKLEDDFVDMLWTEFSHVEVCDWLGGCRKLSIEQTYGKVEKAHFTSAVQAIRIGRIEDEEKLWKATERIEGMRQRAIEFQQRAKEGGYNSVEDYLSACEKERRRKENEGRDNQARQALLKKRVAEAKEMGEDTTQRPEESNDEWLERVLEAARTKYSLQRFQRERGRDRVAGDIFKRADAVLKIEEKAEAKNRKDWGD